MHILKENSKIPGSSVPSVSLVTGLIGPPGEPDQECLTLTGAHVCAFKSMTSKVEGPAGVWNVLKKRKKDIHNSITHALRLSIFPSKLFSKFVCVCGHVQFRVLHPRPLPHTIIS